MIRSSRATLYEREHIWLCAAIGSLIAMIVLYMYFVSASVLYVVMRKEVDREMASLGSTVSELETAFIEAQHAVSADIASHKGFTQADKKIFIDRSETTLVLSN